MFSLRKLTTLRAVTPYQREVVALIRASGARLSILHDHRLVDLWREYSQRVYCCGWVEGDRPEVYRFVTWSNNLRGISREIQLANRTKSPRPQKIRPRTDRVRVWSDKLLADDRRRW